MTIAGTLPEPWGKNLLVTPIKVRFTSAAHNRNACTFFQSIRRWFLSVCWFLASDGLLLNTVMASWIFFKHPHQISNQIVRIGIIQIPQCIFFSLSSSLKSLLCTYLELKCLIQEIFKCWNKKLNFNTIATIVEIVCQGKL